MSAGIAERYNAQLQKRIDRMIAETTRALRNLEGDFPDGAVVDASLASQARIVMNQLRSKFEDVFARLANPLASFMVDQVDANSAATLKSSLREMSEDLNISTDILTADLGEIFKASVQANVGLITRVPSKFFDQMQGEVMRSIQNGEGIGDLISNLNKYGVQTKNWATNVALDQTRKAYNAVSKGRMEALGVEEFEWIHSGGSQHPREYHKRDLHGEIFRFDDLPHLDGPGKGEKGIPGQAPFCRCVMRPVYRFNEEE